MRTSTRPLRIALAATIGGVGLLAVMWVSSVLAVHDLAFQLDGDTSTGDTAPITGVNRPYDWDSLFTGTGATVASLPPGFASATLVKDFSTNTDQSFNTSDPTTLTQGSKDTLDFNNWYCVYANNVTNKGDLMNVYAADYVVPQGMNATAGDRILYFGNEKYQPQGTNNIGIWFLQNPIGCNSTYANPATGSGLQFNGVHTVGDVLIVAAWDSGGRVSTVNAYEWVGGTSPLTLVAASQSCGSVSAGQVPDDKLCGIANSVPITIKWPHASLNDGHGTAGSSPTIPTATFFEGAINLSQFPYFANKCFAQYMMDTRSSTSLTATLYDYALGNINTCGKLTIVKNTIGGNGTFNYVSTGGLPTPAASNGNFSITTSAGTGNAVFDPVQPGQYTVTEPTLPTGWGFKSLTCDASGGTSSATVTDRTAGITMGFLGKVTCTYTNIKPDANINISPLTAYNAIGATHTITATVKVFDGSNGTNFVNAPDGTTVSFSKVSGPGTLGASCTTTNGTCTTTLTSTSVGVTTIHAATSLSVFGVTLSRSTGDSFSGDGSNATKNWEDANIVISPLTAYNAIGATHTITATVKVNDGTGWANATDGTTVSYSVTGAAAKTGTCTTASGTCTFTFSSSTPGVSNISASTSVVLNGVTLNRATGDSNAGDGSNATKNWEDANIVISPLTATNEVNATHTITATVKVNDGTGWADATDGTTVSFTITGPGSLNLSPSCTTTSGICTTTFTSAISGTSAIHASTSVVLNGVTLNRATGDSNAGDGSNATKNWEDAN
ncbi:MAG TPA: Ig-like domain-containing protein, partial [Candidatus Limnocylindrales bacterium]